MDEFRGMMNETHGAGLLSLQGAIGGLMYAGMAIHILLIKLMQCYLLLLKLSS